MAYRCDYCDKGVAVGHAVSHAKNRTRRLFKPNLQKLKVLRNGIAARVKFCTSCIQKLRSSGSLGLYRPLFATVAVKKPDVKPPVAVQPVVSPPPIPFDFSKEEKKVVKKEEKAKSSIAIEDIVGKKT